MPLYALCQREPRNHCVQPRTWLVSSFLSLWKTFIVSLYPCFPSSQKPRSPLYRRPRPSESYRNWCSLSFFWPKRGFTVDNRVGSENGRWNWKQLIVEWCRWDFSSQAMDLAERERAEESWNLQIQEWPTSSGCWINLRHLHAEVFHTIFVSDSITSFQFSWDYAILVHFTKRYDPDDDVNRWECLCIVL